MIRVDLEHAWSNGQFRWLAEYRDRFPSVFEAPEALSGIAFEEYRQRRLHGDPATAAEYGRKYGLDISDWPTVPVVPAVDVATSAVLAPPLADTPPPGTARVAVTPEAGPADPSDPESVAGWVGSANALPAPGDASSASGWWRSWAAGRSAGSTWPGRATWPAGRSP